MSEQNEQQTEKKKAGIVKRISKWLGFGLLILLLIVSVLFQGPWKFTALLAVLMAGTILPKPYAKYFSLFVGGVVIALIIWIFLPEKTEGWRPYTFDKELAALEAKRAILDSENAAIIYNQLLEDYNKAAFEPNFVDPNLKDLIRKEFWLSKDHPEAAQWIGQKEGVIAKLIEASKIEKCRFPIGVDVMKFGDTTDRFLVMRMLANLLITAANNDIAEGRMEDGLEKYIAAIQIGKHLRQQPAMIDLLVGIGVETLSINNLKRFIITGDATEEYLNVAEQAIAKNKYNWGADLPKIIDYEKLLAKNLCGMCYGVSPKGKVRLNLNIAENTIKAQLPKEMKDEFVITYWRERLVKASTIWAWFYMPSTPQKAEEIIDSEYKRFYAMAEPDFDWQKGEKKPAKQLRFNYRYLVKLMIGILEPAYCRIHDTYIQAIAQQRGVLLTIALRHYKNKTGHWPESLDEVKPLAAEEIFVDPINGGHFVYKLTNENIELYSKGKNNIDENGQFSSTFDPNSGMEQILEDDIAIWPPKPKIYKKPKKQVTNSGRAYISELKNNVWDEVVL